MKPADRTLLRAIYLIAVSIGLMLIGYLISGGWGSNLPTILIWVGMILFVFGTLIGVLGFEKNKEDK